MPSTGADYDYGADERQRIGAALPRDQRPQRHRLGYRRPWRWKRYQPQTGAAIDPVSLLQRQAVLLPAPTAPACPVRPGVCCKALDNTARPATTRKVSGDPQPGRHPARA